MQSMLSFLKKGRKIIMLNVRITQLNDHNQESSIILERTTIASLEIYLKRCMELSQQKNKRYKVELSLQEKLHKPLEQKIFNNFIVDKNYVPNEYIKQFLSKDF